jgi:molecular chaperone Hsp33
VSGAAPDDLVLPFEVKPLGVRGRLVRLGPAVSDILRRHSYPEPVSALLAEAVALAAMLGSALKFDGKFILQTRSDGAVDLMVAGFETPDGVRGYARFDAHRIAGARRSLLGAGHLAMTIDQGADMERYQGVVALEGGTLTDAAHRYFQQSEQIPTRTRLAAGPLIERGAAAAWRAGAIMVQHLPDAGPSSPLRFSSGDAPEDVDETLEDDLWVKARLLLDTVEDHELIDPMLTPEQLLYRLFHEDGVTVYPARPLRRFCTCSKERVAETISNFSDEERRDMTVDGRIRVTCEFCSTVYEV